MLQFLKKQANRTRTENGAATYATTMSECLDLFSTVGALRSAADQEILARFVRAFAEDRDLALRTAFFARDIRGGLGERRVFRVMLKYLATAYPQTTIRNLHLVSEYGRWDDLLELLDTPCEPQMLEAIAEQFHRDMQALQAGGQVSLLGKWLPSVNTSSELARHRAKRIARALGMNDAAYRKALSALRRQIGILENNLRERDYTFDYAKQPSRAMLQYRKAFARNDGQRYHDYLEAVAQGKAAMHTGTLYPYELIRPLLDRRCTQEQARAIEVTWNALPDYTDGRNALVVVDGSGSMYTNSNPMPASVACHWGCISPNATAAPSATISSRSLSGRGWSRSRAGRCWTKCATA